MVETSDYRIPGSNAVTLSPALAKEIKERFARDRDNRFHIFLLAAGMRQKYLQRSEGGKDAYRTGNSPFWHVRIYDNLRKRYIVRSSKEKARLTAKEVAEELFDEHRSKKSQAVAVSPDTSFQHYADKLLAHEKAMAARMRGKRFYTDTRAILAPQVRKGSKEKRRCSARAADGRYPSFC